MKRIAIGDVHGCYLTLCALLEKLNLQSGDQVWLLGDLINKGPRSKQVLDLLIAADQLPYELRSVRGNHDQKLLDVNKGNVVGKWLKNAQLRITLQSFGVNSPFEIESKYLQLLESLPYFVELNTSFLVHAGFNFFTNRIDLDKTAMLNTRSKPNLQNLQGKRLICGHIPQPVSVVKMRLAKQEQFVQIDTGCPYYLTPDMGVLTALDIDTLQYWFQNNIDLPYEGSNYYR